MKPRRRHTRQESAGETESRTGKSRSMPSRYHSPHSLPPERHRPLQVLDETGRILFVNDSWQELLGRSADEVEGRAFVELVAGDDQDRFREGYARILSAGFVHDLEVEVRCGDDTTAQVSIDGRIRADDEGASKEVVCVLRDTRLEKQVQREREFFNTMLESLTHPLYVINIQDHVVVLANAAACMGPLDETSTCHKLTHGSDTPCDSRTCPCPIEWVKSTGQPLMVEHTHYDRQGRARNFEVHCYPIVESDGEVRQIIEYCLDVTDRKQAEEKLLVYQEQLRTLASDLSLAEERERHRIATELHDGIGQLLALMKMKLGTLLNRDESRPICTDLDEISELLAQVIRDARVLTSELSPPVLYELGLLPGIEWLLARHREERGVSVSMKDDGEPKPLDRDVEVLLFRSVRELLINSAKHSGAENVSVTLRRSGHRLRIEVCDDGVGFAESPSMEATDGSGFGLFSIRERLNHLNGCFEVQDLAGGGTCCVLEVPLRHPPLTERDDDEPANPSC